MKTKTLFLSVATLFVMLFTACNTEAQNTQNEQTSLAEANVEIIQFHSEHRCYTCNKIEELTRETIKPYSTIPFSLVNVDEKENEAMANEFEAVGTALFLYDPETGNKKELTEFAFMNASNKEKFIDGLKKEISQFGN